MPLATGTQLGPYTVGDEIGAGGMGVVFRATDQNLKRDVAIKALPESFSADADWVARFEREAQTLAALNHPNIAQIYGLERSDGVTALVMELVEGPTLADRIADGPLPPDEALAIAMQTADALEAAHGQGIVHRDLKPANIKLKPDGTVKVLDFGIAKTLDIRAASGQPAAMTTPAMTQTGIILGTAAYMSPEQARGRPIDQRTDIWAFGCLLYEMLTGQPAFAGEDVAITLARILANDTNMNSLPGVVSPAVRHAIELCLQKDARKRLADIRDVRLALEGALDAGSASAQLTPTARVGWRQVFPAASAAVAVTGLVAAAVAWGLWPVADVSPVTRFDYELPDGQSFSGVGQGGTELVAISPDGQAFVYSANSGLYLRAMGDLDARLIPGTETVAGVAFPVFSPNGQALAYFEAPGQIKRIAVSGGAPVLIANVTGPPSGISWAIDNSVLFEQPQGIYRVSANGGSPELVISAEPGEFFYGPRLLPSGDAIVFSVSNGTWNQAHIAVQSLSTGERTVLVSGGRDALYVPTGHLVYAVGDDLFGVAFDLDSHEISGGAVPLVQDVMGGNSGTWGEAHYDVSDSGTLVYVKGSNTIPGRSLVWVDRTGREAPLGAPTRTYAYPRISPDETKVALDTRDEGRDIWSWDFVRQTLTRLTVDSGEDEYPVWFPDGRRIAFSSSRGGGSAADSALYWKAASGTGAAERLTEFPGQIFPTSVLPDGIGILVRTTAVDDPLNDDIAIVQLDDSDEVAPLLHSSFNERNADISPDGNWLLYSSDFSGREEVYVRPFPDFEADLIPISTNGGVQPLWRRDGRELFYRNGDAMMLVTYETDSGFVPGNPQSLFEGEYLGGETTPYFDGRSYDYSSSEDRFLMIRESERTSAAAQIIVVENWTTELQSLVPNE